MADPIRTSVLAVCCGVLAFPEAVAAQPAELRAKVAKALERSRPILLKRLKRAHNGELGLLCLAALHDEVPVANKVFAKALRRLAKANLARTYDIALRLMVMAECPPAAWPKRTAAAQRQGKVLLRHIVKREGFGYSNRDRRWDLSNTQYAVLGLRAAVSLGLQVEPKHWRGILRATFAAQAKDGGFGYMRHRNSTESMTVAGIAVARICAGFVSQKTRIELDVERRLESAWGWLGGRKGAIGDRDTDNSFYFHYGLERACILSDVTAIDQKDWYAAGAEMLLRTQLRVGGWHSKHDIVQGKGEDGADSVSTAFAILFLRRKFQKTLTPAGPITLGGGAPIHLLSVQATKRQVQAAIDSAVQRGRPAVPQILRALRSPLKLRRVAAAKALFRIAGEDFGFNPHVAPERSQAAVKKAEMWYLKKRE